MFSKTAQYALQAVTCLAEQGAAATSSHEIARLTGVPANYLTKILYELSCAGIVSGQRGAAGGYRLSRSLDRIRIIEVMRAVSSLDHQNVRKMTGKKRSLANVLDSAAAAAISILEATTIKDVVKRDEE